MKRQLSNGTYRDLGPSRARSRGAEIGMREVGKMIGLGVLMASTGRKGMGAKGAQAA